MNPDKILVKCPEELRGRRLRQLDGKRVAVILVRGRSESVMCGLARYVQIGGDFTLQITADRGQQPGDPVLEFSESAWDGEIAPDDRFGCDYQLRLGVPS